MKIYQLLICGAESPAGSTGVRIFREALAEKGLCCGGIRYVPSALPEDRPVIVIGTADEYRVKVLLEGSGRQVPVLSN